MRDQVVDHEKRETREQQDRCQEHDLGVVQPVKRVLHTLRLIIPISCRKRSLRIVQGETLAATPGSDDGLVARLLAPPGGRHLRDHAEDDPAQPVRAGCDREIAAATAHC